MMLIALFPSLRARTTDLHGQPASPGNGSAENEAVGIHMKMAESVWGGNSAQVRRSQVKSWVCHAAVNTP